MHPALPTPAPGFDQPIAVLKHCHERIRKQIATLRKLQAHLPQQGADTQAQQAARAVLAYFDQAAPLHHADEEHNLMPMLQAAARGADASALATLVPRIRAEHSVMDALWQTLRAQLAAIADASSAILASELVDKFDTCYQQHMQCEEGQIAPMALRLFGPKQMAALGAAMQARRAPGSAAAGAAAASGPALAALRQDYGQAELSEQALLDDPIAQFALWFEQALAAQVREPNAMSLASVNGDGQPSARIVLIKQYDGRGFTWYTNYDSDKGAQLRANPRAALLFFWPELERQIRIEGIVERTADDESDTYFHSRPLKSRLAAIASAQSAPVADRAALEQQVDAVAAQYGEHPPRPPHWGGLRLVPQRIEFWQGRRSRLHDRIVYQRHSDGSWTRQRLQP